MKLLDTDILVHYLAGHTRVAERVASETESIATTIVTRIEMLTGRFDALMKAADATQIEIAQQRLLETEQQLEKFIIISMDAACAAEFEKLRKQRKLKKIGRADLLIACIALAHRATLVTRSVRHFRQVPGLTIENWAD